MKKLTILTLFLSLFGFQTTHSMEEIEPEKQIIQQQTISLEKDLFIKIKTYLNPEEKCPDKIVCNLIKNDKKIGKCIVTPNFDEDTNTYSGFIKIIYIEKSHQKQGFGKRLLTSFLNYLETLYIRLKYIELQVFSPYLNPHLIPFYKGFGFEIDEAMPKEILCVFMKKEFNRN